MPDRTFVETKGSHSAGAAHPAGRRTPAEPAPPVDLHAELPLVNWTAALESLPFITGDILHIDGGQIAGH